MRAVKTSNTKKNLKKSKKKKKYLYLSKMKEQKAVQETQGVKKVQKASVSYALKAVEKHIETMEKTIY